MAPFSLPFTNLAGNEPGSSGMDGSVFGSMLQQQQERSDNPYDPDKQILPWLVTEMQRKEDMYNDPDRLRELMNVYKEFRGEEAKQAFDMQMKRDLVNLIPKTAESVATMIYNPQRQQILASIPGQIADIYRATPFNPVRRSVTFG
jgi:hypothetical protein